MKYRTLVFVKYRTKNKNKETKNKKIKKTKNKQKTFLPIVSMSSLVERIYFSQSIN